jgi:hypothetical protein
VATGEEVASLAGRFEPATFAAHVSDVAHWYQGAAVLVERNNHGHTVLLWLREHAPDLRLLYGHDGKPGWNTTTKSKAVLYDVVGQALRDAETVLHGLDTFAQLASIEGSTLRAPEGQHDDRAVAFALAVAGGVRLVTQSSNFVEQGPCVLIPGRPDCFAPDYFAGPGAGAPARGAQGHGAEVPWGWW